MRSDGLLSRFTKWFRARRTDRGDRAGFSGELPPPQSAASADFDQLLDKARTQYREALDEMKDR